MSPAKFLPIFFILFLFSPAYGAATTGNFSEVFPEADSFSEISGDPPVAEAYSDGKLVGYVFYTNDIVDIPGYSGRPIVFLVGLDTYGTITGVKLIEHHEPIMLVGVEEERLRELAAQLVGVNVASKVVMGKKEPGAVSVDFISGATLTGEVALKTIMQSSRIVAMKKGLLVGLAEPKTKYKLKNFFEEKTFEELVKEGSLKHFVIMPEDIGAEAREPGTPWMDIYFGYVNPPSVGRSLFGERRYKMLFEQFGENASFIYIAGSGTGSFKGSAYVRGGQFERVKIIQGLRTYTFSDRDYTNIFDLHAKDAPEFKESVVFVVRDPSFDPTRSFTLVVSYKDNRVSVEYRAPLKYFEIPLKDRIAMYLPSWAREVLPRWLDLFFPKGVLYIILLGSTLVLFIFRKKLFDGRRTFSRRVRYVVMFFSLVLLGWLQPSQPTTIQAATLLNEIGNWLTINVFHWSLFFSDPFIATVFIFIAIVTLIWGRGVFCGWICPFGAITEFLNEITRRRYELPRWLHERLTVLRLMAFFLVVWAFTFVRDLGIHLGEIEPFKTAFYVGLNRSWPYIAYLFGILALSMLIYRPFCRYLCPFGGGLSMLSLVQFSRIPRYRRCGTCKICERECPVRAISDFGEIDIMQCIRCGRCEENYHDWDRCPTLREAEKRGCKRSNTAWDECIHLVREIREKYRTRRQKKLLEETP